jgi:hypothetical protein
MFSKIYFLGVLKGVGHLQYLLQANKG